MAEIDDSAVTARATYDSANAYKMYAYRALMLVIRDEINTIRTHSAIGLASKSEATWVANVKTKIDEDAGIGA